MSTRIDHTCSTENHRPWVSQAMWIVSLVVLPGVLPGHAQGGLQVKNVTGPAQSQTRQCCSLCTADCNHPSEHTILAVATGCARSASSDLASALGALPHVPALMLTITSTHLPAWQHTKCLHVQCPTAPEADAELCQMQILWLPHEPSWFVLTFLPGSTQSASRSSAPLPLRHLSTSLASSTASSPGLPIWKDALAMGLNSTLNLQWTACTGTH